MKRLYVVVEGQAEQSFVKEVLAPCLWSRGDVSVVPILIKTGRIGRGGFVNFHHLKDMVLGLLSNKKATDLIVTTFVDFFRIPSNVPGYAESMLKGADASKADALQEAMSEVIKDRRFVPYIQLHEFEALLFSNNSGFEYLWDNSQYSKTCEIIISYPNPEDINSGPSTAPSKRLINIKPDYNKVIEGNLIALQVGINDMINKCPRFAKWIESLVDLVNCA